MNTRFRRLLLLGLLLACSQIYVFILHGRSIRMLVQQEAGDERMMDMIMLSEPHDNVLWNNNNEKEVATMNTTVASSAQKQNKQQRVLVHLHIGKNGGTALDGLGRKLATQINHQYIGYRHFDWSYIENIQTKHDNHVNVITMLRSPISRAASHFFSAQIWMPQLRVHGNLTLREYINNTNLLLSTRRIWSDGQAGVSWLAGIHTEDWVVGKLNATEMPRREDLYMNHAKEMCRLAADRLDSTVWFGILEDLHRSMELLQYALQLNETPSLPRGNVNPRPKPNITPWERDALASLMPMDMWLYDYGKRLFEARYKEMTTGIFIKPQRPPLPDTWSCTSNCTSLECVDGVLKGSHRLHQRGVLRKTKA